ncbi:uncharacterized [Tachysurus ichikawai]
MKRFSSCRKRESVYTSQLALTLRLHSLPFGFVHVKVNANASSPREGGRGRGSDGRGIRQGEDEYKGGGGVHRKEDGGFE